MKHGVAILVFAAALYPVVASAQANLTPQQQHGRMILTQNCNICHLPQNPGSQTYGPMLNKESANGDDNLMKQVIQTGLVKMPGWRYTLNDNQIADVIAYIRTLPVVAPPPPGKQGKGGGGGEN